MDTAMRDLERIQERDYEDGNKRRAGVFVLAAVVTLMLVYGIGSMLGPLPESSDAADDPLAALDRAAALSIDAQAAEEQAPRRVEVNRQALTFPGALVGSERPEVEAAVAAAAAEHALLAFDDEEPPAPRPATLQPLPVAAPVNIAAALPASSMAMGESQDLAAAAQHDVLVASALPAEETPERGEVGEDGTFTLQVISYRTREEAEVFSEALRTRGHDSFVLEGEVEGRGTFYRVRVGPFPNGRAAERYRRTFEREEGMNTFVVHRRD